MKREEVVSALRYLTSDKCTETQHDYEDEIRAAIDLLEHSEPIVNAVWVYYTNDEGKARWRCSECGHVVKHDPNDYKRCACGAHMTKEA